ncbi:MAG: GNAT family N-acetyltransferase [Candidatus Hodarchaeota archaeon]
MNIEIKDAKISDIEPFYVLWKEMQGSHEGYDEDFYKPNLTLKPEDVKAYFKGEMESKDAIILLAFLNDEMIGFIHAGFGKRPPVYHYKDEVRISIVGVSGKYRGKGVGTALISALENRIKRAGFFVSLSVDVDNSAVGLYERLGFKKRHVKMYKKY